MSHGPGLTLKCFSKIQVGIFLYCRLYAANFLQKTYLFLVRMGHELVDLHVLHPHHQKYHPHTPDQCNEPHEALLRFHHH